MRLAIIAVAAFVSFAQTTKVFRFTQSQSPQDLEEISRVLRGTAEIPEPSIDNTTRTITVNATDGQIAMASWLVQQLDLPPAGASGGVHEYRDPAGGDDLVRVLYARHAPAAQVLQAMVTAVRSVADIRRLFVYNPLQAVVVRGTNQQILLGAWLMDELDQPPNGPAPAPQEYKLPGDDVARVFDIANAQKAEDMQEMVTLIRSVAEMPRIFVCTDRRAIALRATTERVALAAWLVNELDRPASALPAGAVAHEFRLSDDPKNIVRVYYLTKLQSREALDRLVKQVRETARTYRMFVYNPLAALAVRGSSAQLSAAEKTIARFQGP